MIRPDGRLTLRKGTSSSNSPILTFTPRSFSLNRWHGRRTLRDRCQEKEWKRTDGKSPRSCQCRRASANEKALPESRTKESSAGKRSEASSFSLHLLTLCRLVWWVTKVCVRSHLSPTLPTKTALWFSMFMILDLWEHVYFKQSTSLRTKTLHGHVLDWDTDTCKIPWLKSRAWH